MEAMDEKMPQDELDEWWSDDMEEREQVLEYLASGQAHEIRRALHAASNREYQLARTRCEAKADAKSLAMMRDAETERWRSERTAPRGGSCSTP